MKLSKSTKRAIKKYGIQTCLEAYKEHYIEGSGASTVSWSFSILKGNIRAGDAAIDAGRELENNSIKN